MSLGSNHKNEITNELKSRGKMNKKKIFITISLLIFLVIAVVIIFVSISASTKKKADQDEFYKVYDSYKTTVLSMFTTELMNSDNIVQNVDVEPQVDLVKEVVKGNNFYTFNEDYVINIIVDNSFDDRKPAEQYELCKKLYDSISPIMDKAEEVTGLSKYFISNNGTCPFLEIFNAANRFSQGGYDVIIKTNVNEYEFSPIVDGDNYLRINDKEYYGDKFTNLIAGCDTNAPTSSNGLTPETKLEIINWIKGQYEYYDTLEGGDSGDKYSNSIMQDAADKFNLSVDQVFMVYSEIN